MAAISDHEKACLCCQLCGLGSMPAIYYCVVSRFFCNFASVALRRVILGFTFPNTSLDTPLFSCGRTGWVWDGLFCHVRDSNYNIVIGLCILFHRLEHRQVKRQKRIAAESLQAKQRSVVENHQIKGEHHRLEGIVVGPRQLKGIVVGSRLLRIVPDHRVVECLQARIRPGHSQL